MKSKLFKNYLFLHVLLFVYSLCGVFSKLASKNEFLSFEFILFYGLSIFILGVYAILWQQILKKFQLTTAFFNKAITIVWGMLWGFLIFHETVKPNMIIGAFVVLLGISLVVKEYE